MRQGAVLVLEAEMELMGTMVGPGPGGEMGACARGCEVLPRKFDRLAVRTCQSSADGRIATQLPVEYLQEGHFTVLRPVGQKRPAEKLP